MRELVYVGPFPKVSQHGVTFDPSRPDAYAFLSAALEILETLREGEEGADVFVHTIRPAEYDGKSMVRLLEAYCNDVNEIFEAGEEKMREAIEAYRADVEKNPSLSADEREAWLGNVEAMRDYFQQYMTNARAYECVLHAIADIIAKKRIETIRVPLGRNYGLVLADLIAVLQDHKPPFDATMRIEKGDTIGYAVLETNRPVPLDI
jgi:hypothetical protein